MRIRVFFAGLLILTLSCNRDKHNQANVNTNKLKALIAQQKTIDSLILIYDTLSHAIPYAREDRTLVPQMLYVMTHPGIARGSEFSDLQIRINNLEGDIKNKKTEGEEFINWIDTVKSLINRVAGQPIDFYQFTETHEEYYKEITVISYPDSAMTIVRGYICDTAGKCWLAGREQKRISKRQWDTMGQKAYNAHFWQMELKEMAVMGEGGFLNIKAASIDSKGIPKDYQEIVISPTNGSLEDMYKYTEQLVSDTERIFFEIPRRRHHGC